MGFEWLPKKNYKRHYICLGCQKGFKRPSEKDMKKNDSVDLSNLMKEYYSHEVQQDLIKYIKEAYQQLAIVCPNCKHQMIQVHYDFEVPPQRDNKSWKKLQLTKTPASTPPYKTYLEWHRLALQKKEINANKFKLLKQNLSKLEKIV